MLCIDSRLTISYENTNIRDQTEQMIRWSSDEITDYRCWRVLTLPQAISALCPRSGHGKCTPLTRRADQSYHTVSTILFTLLPRMLPYSWTSSWHLFAVHSVFSVNYNGHCLTAPNRSQYTVHIHFQPFSLRHRLLKRNKHLRHLRHLSRRRMQPLSSFFLLEDLTLLLNRVFDPFEPFLYARQFHLIQRILQDSATRCAPSVSRRSCCIASTIYVCSIWLRRMSSIEQE